MLQANQGHADNPQSDDGQLPGILARPAEHLRALPVRYRWEVTRRHPYYVMLWSSSQWQVEDQNGPDGLMQQQRMAVFGAIGVSGPVIPPSVSADEIMTHIDGTLPAWLSGSVQPLTMRGLTGLLLAHLSQESRRQLALLFGFSADGHEHGEDNIVPALLRLQTLECCELDKIPDQPIIAVSPIQTVNVLMSDLRNFLEEFRERQSLAEQRVRVDKFDQYLAVWDARERWTGSGYETGDDHRLSDVARQLGISESTIRNQYRAAFELITGHCYSAAKWLRIFGPLKYPAETMNDINGAVMRRRLQPRGARPPVPESILTSHEGPSVHNSRSTRNHEIAIWELVEDFKVLSKAGRSDTEIAQQLETTLPVVAALKSLCETD